LPRRIEEDHKSFRDVIGGRIRKVLKKFFKTGQNFPQRAKNGKMSYTIPSIDIPHIVHGESNRGLNRGPGKKGDVLGRDKDGDGKGNQAGEGEGEGIVVSIDMEDVIDNMGEELELPPMVPKDSELIDETYLRYNSLSKQGPRSLRHPRKTIQQAMKRLAATKELDKLHMIPGYPKPMPMIVPQESDFRYRQYTIHNKPSSNAVIFFARDGSGSMDQTKCDIVSDMCWWMDHWIRRFYDKTERVYIWHDWTAAEVDEEKFYKYRYGGGTQCSSVVKLIADQLQDRFPPNKWNVYVFYFTDGDNWGGDNQVFVDLIKKELPPQVVNMLGITQVMSYSYDGSLKQFVDSKAQEGFFGNGDYIRTTSVENPRSGSIANEQRNEGVKKAIQDLLGKSKRPNVQL